MRKLLPALVAFSLVSWGTGAQAQMQPVSAEQLGEAVGACLRATQGDAEMGEALSEMGWAPATIESSGKAVETDGMTIRGHSDNRAVIMTTDAEGDRARSCAVVGRIPSVDRYHPSAEAISRIAGDPVRREDDVYYWLIDGRVAQLAPTGSREEPSLRFFIMQREDSE
ncbi:hypothetical protein LCM19_03110 [Qipengyuania flava]|nr:hypothetical protein [Qipengyuania flava]